MASLFPRAAAQFEAVADRLRAAEKVSVVAHVKPDADAVGSACALVGGLRQLGVDASAHIGQPLPHSANLRTVPGVDEIAYGTPLPKDGLVVTVDLSLIHI